MPDYLQYRDSGYMYSPHPKFIPLFFRQVDTTVKHIVNPNGFEKHGELIKVKKIVNLKYIIHDFFSGGSFGFEPKLTSQRNIFILCYIFNAYSTENYMCIVITATEKIFVTNILFNILHYHHIYIDML